MALKEYYNSGDNGFSRSQGVAYTAQTFTASDTYTMVSVKLKCYKVGNPGDVYVSINEVSEGIPTWTELAVAIVDSGVLSTDTGGVWTEFTFVTPLLVTNGTMYAIVVGAPFGGVSNCVEWRRVGPGSSYPGGSMWATSTTNFTEFSSYDQMFETYSGDYVDLEGGLVIPEQLEDMPENKAQHGFEELNGLFYAVCGGTAGGVHSKKVYAYDPLTDNWTEKSDAPVEVQSPVVRAVNGKLYLIGGYNSTTHTYYDNVYEYDPDTDVWTEKTNMPEAFEDMGSCVIDGKIYVFGGVNGYPDHLIVDHVYVYDPVEDSWETRSWSSNPRCLGDFAEMYNGKAYLIGGVINMSGYSYPIAVAATKRVEEYDPVLETFTTKTSCDYEVCYHEVTELNGLLYVFTGCGIDGEVREEDQVYDITLDMWKSRPTLGYTAAGLATLEYNGSLYFSGGQSGSGGVFSNDIASLYRLTPISSSDMSSSLGDLEIDKVGGVRYSAFNLQLDYDRS